MEARELRIGNYLHDAKGKLAIVEGLSKDNIKAYSGMVTPLPLKPIPLTEQWLLDFGFEHNIFKYSIGVGKGKTLELAICNDKGKGEYYCFFRDLGHKNEDYVCFRPRCFYVHQLQNLYHALTGEELEIK